MQVLTCQWFLSYFLNSTATTVTDELKHHIQCPGSQLNLMYCTLEKQEFLLFPSATSHNDLGDGR